MPFYWIKGLWNRSVYLLRSELNVQECDARNVPSMIQCLANKYFTYWQYFFAAPKNDFYFVKHNLIFLRAGNNWYLKLLNLK